MHTKNNSGFTMLEMLIVAIIIGILASLAIPHYARTMERSKCSQALNILTNMRRAALMYYTDNETFATMTTALLETQVNADFDTTDENPNWNFSIDSANVATFTLEAVRTAPGHPNNLETITINETGVIGGTYDTNNPADW